MYKVWTFFLQHRQFTVLLMVALVLMGVMSLLAIPKESAPEVKVPIAVVVTALPGASATDVEALVTNKLERPLKSGLADVKNITSTSAEGISSITVEFDAAADLQTALNDLRDEVDIAKIELPTEAEDPRIIRIDFAAEPVVTLSISADLPDPVLFEIGEELQDELEGVTGVSTVSISGARNREVQVLIDRARLSSFDLTAGDVTRALGAANVSIPAGSIEINAVEYPVRFSGDLTTAEAIGDVPVTARAGAPVYVRDIATVIDGYAQGSTISRTSIAGEISKPSLTIDTFKASNANITDVSGNVLERLDELGAEGELLADVQVSIVFDRGDLLVQDLSNLGWTGVQTTILVMIVLALAIGWREALIAASAIPLSLFIAFVAMRYSGNTLNFVSLFSLVLVIGIIVDAAIVMVEGINTRVRKNGVISEAERGIKAAHETISEFHVPLTAGTMTTVAVFAPLFLVSGITGEFIKSIPFTVIAVLFAALLVSIGFIPLIASKFAGKSIGGFGGRRGKIVDGARNWYRTYLKNLLSNRRNAPALLASIVIMLVLVFMLPFTGALKVVFFEGGDEDFMFVEVELPQGSTLTRTDIELQKVEEVLYTIPEIESFTATAGRSSQFGGTQGSSSGEKLANIFIILNEDRERSSKEVADALREAFTDFRTADVRVGELENGPPTGSAIVISFFGDDLRTIDKVTNDAAALLKQIPGTSAVTTTTKDNETSFVVQFDRAQAISEGITARDAAGTLRTTLFGSTATVLRGVDEDVDVRVLVDLADTRNPDIASAIDPSTLLMTPLQSVRSNSPALLGSFATIEAQESRAVIPHEDGRRIARVSSGLTANGNARVVTQEFERRVEAGELILPVGVEMQVGGENEDVDQSFMDMFVALIIGIIGIFAILVLQFNSFRFAWYVLLTVPLSLIGVFGGLLIADRPVSFPSIMGFIALSGIIVNNAIIMIDSINNARRARPDDAIDDVVIDAAVSRLRPVILTTITTVIGIIPLLFVAELWVPLAISVMFGLAFATILTLVLVPAIYARWPGKAR